MSANSDKVLEIFIQAKAKPDGQERQQFLDAACRNHPEWRAEIESLLRANAVDGESLEITQVIPEFATERAGSLIDRYKLLEKIGEGGMGTVWLAEQTEPVRRRVALKLIKQGMDSRQVLARFEAERQALALMDHPHIAKVLDAGATSTGRPYFVMELVKGVPITKFCDEQRLSIRERLELFAPVCQAIQHAHQKGIIHRDIKPSNILVAMYDDKPVPKVIDFGIAKAMGQQLTERTIFTGFGAVVGTLEYMSPEQADLNQLDIDTRSDIYSLGVLLYELLTGTTPLTRETIQHAAFDEVLRRIREQEPPRPSTRLSESKDLLPAIFVQRKLDPTKLRNLVRGDLDWIVMKCLEKDRRRRYDTANGIASDLQRHLKGEPVSAVAPTAGYRLGKFVRRHRVGVSAAAAFLVLLIGAIAMMLGLLFHATSQQRRANTLLDRINLQRAEDFFKADKAHEGVAYLASLLRKNPDNQAAAERLISALTHRSFCLPLTEPLKHDDQVLLARFSPDGNQAVTVTAGHTVRFWDVMKGDVLRSFIHGGPVNSIEFKRSGELLLIASTDKTASLWDLRKTGVPIRTFKHASAVTGAHFMADSDRILTLSSDNSSQIWSISSGQTIGRPRPEGISAREETDNRIVLASADKTTRAWDLRSGEISALLHHREHICAEEVSPEGDLAATMTGDNRVLIWNVSNGLQIAQIDSHEGWMHSVQFSPDGERLVTASADGSARVWEARTGKPLTAQMRHAKPVYFAAFSPEGLRVVTASADGTARVWDALTATPAGEPMRHGDEVYRAEWSMDGTRVITASKDKTARLWDAHPGHALSILELRPWGLAQQALTNPRLKNDGEVWIPTVKTLVFVQKFDEAKAEGLPGHAGIDTSKAPEFLRGRDFHSVVQPYLGKSLTLNDIKALQSSTAKFAANKGIPFLDVFYPEQDSTDGIVQMVAATNLFDDLPADTGLALLHEPPQRAGINERRRDYASFVGRKPELMSQASKLFRPGTILFVGDALWSVDSFKPIVDTIPWQSTWPACFSRDGLWVAAYTDDKVKVANLNTLETVISPLATSENAWARLAHKGPVYDMEFSWDSRFIVTAGFDKTARIWRTDTSQPAGPPMEHSQWVYRARFNATGTRVVTASADHTARVWDAQTAQPRTRPLKHDGRVYSAEFSPDGRTVLTASEDNTARVWDASSGLPRYMPLRHQNIVYTARFSADGNWIVTASADNTARIWNARSGLPANEALTHRSTVFSAVFSPDSRRVVTVSSDGTARLWETLSGMPLSEPLPHRAETYLAQFSPDGDWLATESEAGLSIWEVPNLSSSISPSVLDIAEAVAGVRFDREGQRSLVAASELFRASKEVQATSADDFYTRWAKWFFADRETRKISPSNPLSTREYIRRCIKQDDLQMAVRLSPTNAIALASLAKEGLYPQATLGSEAEAYLRRARKYGGNDSEVKAIEADILRLLAQPQEDTKKSDVTLETIDHGLARKPDDVDLWRKKGTLLEASNDFTGSLRAFSKVIELKPEDPDGWFQRARVYRKRRDWSNAAWDYAKVSQIYSNNYQYHRTHALLRLATADFDRYRAACVQLLEQAKGWQKYSTSAVVRTFTFGPGALTNMDMAASMLEADSKTSKPSSSVLNTYGAVEYRAGRFEAARKALSDSLKLSTNSPFSLFFLAMTHAQLNSNEEARAALRQAISQLEELQRRNRESDWERLLELEILRKEAERTVTEAERKDP